MMPAFPKIWAVGSLEIKESLFNGPVEVTEKIDGSQLGFGRSLEGKLMIRSKGAPIYNDDSIVRVPDKLFKYAVDYILSVQHKIDPGVYFYGEVVSSVRHNTLTYGRVPTNCIMLYGVMVNGEIKTDYDFISNAAEALGIEPVPLIFTGQVNDISRLQEWLGRDSTLGGTRIEGVVIKNYAQKANSAYSSYCFGKFVSEAFKELNGANWKGIKSENSLDSFIEQFTSEGRWKKAIQHFRDDGKLTDSPKDIGPLIEEIIRDTFEENEEMIKARLFKHYKRIISGAAVKNFPAFYKTYLAEGSTVCQDPATAVSENQLTSASTVSTQD